MKRRAIVMVAALALAGGACGGDDDADVTDDAAAPADESNDDAAAPADESNDDANAGDDDGDDSGGDWCELARGIDSESDLFDSVDFTDPDAFESAYQQMIDIFDDAADSAPDEIKDDIELVLDRSRRAFEALQDADFNVLDVDQSVFEDPEADAASDRIDAYNESVCGIESDSGDTGSTDDTVGDTDDGGTGDLDGTMREQLVTQFQTMGMTEDQANCLVDNLDLAELTSSDASDPSAFLDLFETCDIDLSQLTPGG